MQLASGCDRYAGKAWFRVSQEIPETKAPLGHWRPLGAARILCSLLPADLGPRLCVASVVFLGTDWGRICGFFSGPHLAALVSFPMLLFELWLSSPWTPGGSRGSWSGNEADASLHPGPGAAGHLESVSFKAWFYLVSDFRCRVRLSLLSHRTGSLQKVHGKCVLQKNYAWIFKQILHQKYLLIPFSMIFLKCARLCEAVLQHLKYMFLP